MKMKKRGGAKIISIYWFAILLIVAGGIFAMVYSFYNHPYDVRELEAKTMLNKIADCLSNQGQLNSDIFKDKDFSQSFSNTFLEQCHINLNVEETFEDEPQYFFRIDFYNQTNLSKSLFNIQKGNYNLVAGCEIQKQKNYKTDVRCLEDGFFSFDKGTGAMYLIKILTIIKKTEKNVE